MIAKIRNWLFPLDERVARLERMMIHLGTSMIGEFDAPASRHSREGAMRGADGPSGALFLERRARRGCSMGTRVETRGCIVNAAPVGTLARPFRERSCAGPTPSTPAPAPAPPMRALLLGQRSAIRSENQAAAWQRSRCFAPRC